MNRSGQICAAKSELQARFVIVHTAASTPARISASVKASSGPTTLLAKQMTSIYAQNDQQIYAKSDGPPNRPSPDPICPLQGSS